MEVERKMSRMGWAVSGAVLIMALAALLAAVRVSQPARTITVSGEGVAKSTRSQDHLLSISLTARNTNAVAAWSELGGERRRVLALLAAQGVSASAVRWQNLDVSKPSPLVVQKLQLARPPGAKFVPPAYLDEYTASETLQLTHLSGATAQKLSQSILNAGIAAGVNTFQGQGPEVSAQVRIRALEAAVADARTQAAAQAEKLGLGLGPVLRVAPPPAVPIKPFPNAMGNGPVVRPMFRVLAPGQVAATVEVTFALR